MIYLWLRGGEHGGESSPGPSQGDNPVSPPQRRPHQRRRLNQPAPTGMSEPMEKGLVDGVGEEALEPRAGEAFGVAMSTTLNQ